MITYENYKESLVPLGPGDTVVFKLKDATYTFKVRNNHLEYQKNPLKNDILFRLLGLDRYAFCTLHYTYKTDKGDWPICRTGDYSALTNVVKALFEECEKVNTAEDIVFEYEKAKVIKYDAPLAEPMPTYPFNIGDKIVQGNKEFIVLAFTASKIEKWVCVYDEWGHDCTREPIYTKDGQPVKLNGDYGYYVKACELELVEKSKQKDPYPDSLYKVGDKVTIRKEYLPGTDKDSYSLYFPSEMIEEIGGKVLTIRDISPHGKKSKICTDTYRYHCVETGWTLTADMFEETELTKYTPPLSKCFNRDFQCGHIPKDNYHLNIDSQDIKLTIKKKSYHI